MRDQAMVIQKASTASLAQSLLLLALLVAASVISINAQAQCVGDCGEPAQEATESSTTAQWSEEQCDKVKKASGRYLKLSAQAMKKSHNADDLQAKETAFKAGVALNQMAANTAGVYDVFCKD